MRNVPVQCTSTVLVLVRSKGLVMAAVLGSAHLELRNSSVETMEGVNPGMGLFSKVVLENGSLIPYFAKIVKREPHDISYTMTVGNAKVGIQYFFFDGMHTEFRNAMLEEALSSMEKFSRVP